MDKNVKIVKSRYYYTEEEDQFIADNYKNMKPDEIGQNIGKTVYSIRNRISRLGLHKPKKSGEERKPKLPDNYYKVKYKANGKPKINEVPMVLAKTPEHARQRVYNSLTSGFMEYKDVIITEVSL